MPDLTEPPELDTLRLDPDAIRSRIDRLSDELAYYRRLLVAAVHRTAILRQHERREPAAERSGVRS